MVLCRGVELFLNWCLRFQPYMIEYKLSPIFHQTFTSIFLCKRPSVNNNGIILDPNFPETVSEITSYLYIKILGIIRLLFPGRCTQIWRNFYRVDNFLRSGLERFRLSVCSPFLPPHSIRCLFIMCVFVYLFYGRCILWCKLINCISNITKRPENNKAVCMYR